MNIYGSQDSGITDTGDSFYDKLWLVLIAVLAIVIIAVIVCCNIQRLASLIDRLVGQVQRRDQPQSVHSQSSSPEVRSHPVIVLPAVGPNSSASDRSVALHVRSIDNMQPLHSPSAHQPQAPALAVFLSSAQSEAAAQPAHLQMIISNCDPVCPLSQEETPHQISTSPCAGTYQEESTDQEGDATQARVPVPASAVGTCGMCHRRYQIPNQDQVITPVVVENAHPSPAGRADSCGAVE